MSIYREAAELVQKEMFACHAILIAEGKKINQKTEALERFERMFRPNNNDDYLAAWYSTADDKRFDILSRELGLLFMAEISEELEEDYL